jgi:hypothetical protein
MIRREKKLVVVDDATIANGHIRDIIHPVWWLSTIYDGPGMYEESLKQFSRPQRLVRALMIYRYEVSNGGHNQFFSNSAGIVWRDAEDAFQVIGLPRGAKRLSEKLMLRNSAPRHMILGLPPEDPSHGRAPAEAVPE